MLFKNRGTVSYIAVFLGNPGPRFDNTRHNAGFMAADITADTADIKINRIKFNSLTALCTLGGQRVFLMKPQTFMNLSGGAVRQAMDFYKLPIENIIAVSDDIALPLGALRIRRSGSAGGHNGLKDIIAKCGGDSFPRIKIGVGAAPRDDYDTADWVLSRFTPEEQLIVTETAKRAALALETILNSGIDSAMSKFNSKI